MINTTNTSESFRHHTNSLQHNSRHTTSIDEEITILHESKSSTPIEIDARVDPFERNDETISPSLVPTWRRPSSHSTSSIICPTSKPHPIYGRRNTIFSIQEQTQLDVSNETLPKDKSHQSKSMFGCCSKGVRISHVLLIVFIIQGLVGLIPTFILIYSSGNGILEKVSKYQAQQTQSYVNFEIYKILNTSKLVIQQIALELENEFPLSNLTELSIFAVYLRSLYVKKSPLTAIQFANFRDNYIGTLDSPNVYPPVIEYLNGTGEWLYHFLIKDDSIQDPIPDKDLYNVETFKFKPTKRPWYAPFKQGNSTEQRWSDIYVSTFGELSINNAMPVYVQENITAAVLEGKSIEDLNLKVCNCKHPDHLYGVFGALFTLKGLNDFLNRTSRPYEFISYSFIMLGNGSVIASSRRNSTKQEIVDLDDEEIEDVASYIHMKGIFKNNSIAKECTFKVRGKNVAISPITDPRGLYWAIVIGSEDADIFKEILSSGVTSVVVFIVILVAGTLILFVMVQLFTQPLNNIHKKLSKILTDKNLSKDIGDPKITAAGMIFVDIGEMENGINSLKRGVSAFSKFVSPNIMKKVIRDEHYLDVGMTIQNMTILVSSIYDFTLLAEQTETSKFVALMTDYFGSLTKVMEDHRGLIDMITGGRLQVVWNDSSMPIEEHEIRSCKAAMEALEVIEEMNHMWQSEKQMDVNLSVCMSISSGNMLYGSLGSEHRLNFTAIGDEVNIGTKLPNLDRYYGAKVLISENTYQHVKNEFLCYFADYILLIGKETPTRIYSLQCFRNEATDLQIKVSKDLELVQDYLFQNNYRAMYDICERLDLIAPSKIINNLLKKAKRKITTH